MNIGNRPPLGLKQHKADKKRRTPMRRKSRKKIAYEASPEGKADAAVLDAVRAMPCAACGKAGPSEAHHCKDIPPFDEQGLYKRLPGAGLRSDDSDAIPLCGPGGCHWLFHNKRSEFHKLYGVDYGYIPIIRAKRSTEELDF